MFRAAYAFAAVLTFGTIALAVDPPRVFTSDGRDLLKARDALAAGDEKLKDVVDDIVKDAGKLLSVPPYSVMNKQFTPPSGDKHDYMSLSPYWWPDPAKPDGKPYIRKDGQFNPEREKYDLDGLDKMSKAVETLGMAYFFTNDQKYAQKAAELMRTWFLDDSTKMNPNLKFAQFVPGYTEPRPSGIIEGTRFRRVIDGVGLIAGSQHWTKADQQKLQSWCGELLDYLQTSEQGKGESQQSNNHGSWYHVQTGTYALFIDDKERARKLIEESFKRLIDSQIQPDGSQPEEMRRTQSLHYHRYNTLALMDLAMLGERIDVDLWSYKTTDGRSLRTALDYLTSYALKEKDWPGEQINPIKYGDFINLYRRAANAYNEPKYEEIAKKIAESERRPMVDLLFPSKLK